MKDVEDGAYLKYYRLIPTFLDRKEFYCALDNKYQYAKDDNDSLILRGKRFFLEKFKKVKSLDEAVQNILTNLIFVYFEIDNDGEGQKLF